MRGTTGADAPRMSPLILAQRGARRDRDDDLGLMGGAIINANANGDFTLDLYPGVYHVARMLQAPPPPYYLESVRIGGADLLTQDVPVYSSGAISVVYKKDVGSVRGKAENCFSGGVLLVPTDPALHRRGFSKSAPCDSSGQYDVRAVRPGDYYALAFAGNGPVIAIDDELLKSASKVTVRPNEASQLDLRAVTRPVF
jgi:hypothetical protein